MKVRNVVIMVGACLLLFVTAAVAADSRAEVFGGYQYTRLDEGSGSSISGSGSGGTSEHVNANGWNGAFSTNFTQHLGVTADFSGSYATFAGINVKTYTYTFGPVISGRKDATFVPFAHALFGGFRASAELGGASASTNGFAMMVGGGVDARISDKLAVRVGQFDWVSLRANGDTENKNFRYSAGVVLHF
jgi:opacity protein-like surface antigen